MCSRHCVQEPGQLVRGFSEKRADLARLSRARSALFSEKPRTSALFGESLFSVRGVIRYFTQILRAVQAIQEENPVQVINLMLQGPGEDPFRADAQEPAAHILPFDDNFRGTPDVDAVVAWNAQAAIHSNLLAFAADYLRIGHGDSITFVCLFVGNVDYKQAYTQPDLGRGQSDSLSRNHRLKHISHKLRQ